MFTRFETLAETPLKNVKNPLSIFPILLMIVILLYHTRHTAPVYRAKFRKCSSIPLKLHIVAGTFEIVKYHTLAVTKEPAPDFIDLLACFVQSITNLILAKTLIRGNETTRPTYQIAGLARPVLGLAAFSSGSATIHHSSVKIVNGFLYTRMIIFFADLLHLGKIHSGSTIYAYAVFLGGLFAVYEANLPASVPLYVWLVGVVTSLNRRISEQFERHFASARDQNEQIRLSQAARFLGWVGLIELPELKEYTNNSELVEQVDDDYS